MTVHKPVLFDEVLEHIHPQPGQHIIDCTLGGGGHTLALLEQTAPHGKVLAIDADPDAIERVKARVREQGLAVADRLVLVNDNFRNIKAIYESRLSRPVSGVLCDLGLSSDQLESAARGFSFQKSEPLEMTFGHGDNARLTATTLLATYSVDELERIFRAFAQEPRARDIAREIIEARKRAPITMTDQLVEVVESVKGKTGENPRIHPATKVFQAIRIEVNDELTSLEQLLPDALDVLEPGGHLAIISFHELEDRMVKRFFKAQEREGTLSVITKKPVTASDTELTDNPRARSAKLRVAQKT